MAFFTGEAVHQLNEAQRRAVIHTGSPLLVIAGAGSGKTGVITKKIAHLAQGGLPPASIYALTFTNKAAREMQQRCGQLMRDNAHISTFHRLGLEFIRAEASHLQLRRNFTVLDNHDCLNIIKELSQETDSGRAQEQQNLISNYKNDGLSPEFCLANQLPGAALYQGYEQRLRAYNVLDFDDLLLFPLRLLRENFELRLRWQSKIRYLLVDEYQDTNQCQYELMKLLVGDRSCLTVVGDDDQSIYGWRGAKPENIRQLAADFPALTTIKLEQNYRCHRAILHCANALISHNDHLYEKKLWSNLSAGDGLRLKSYKDDKEEAQQVVQLIDTKIKLYGYSPGDFAILYRSNFQSRVFEEYLRESRIDYHITGGTSLFDYSEIRDLLAYLRLVSNGDDDSAFLRICNTPKREIGLTTLSKLTAYGQERGQSLLASCRDFNLISQLPAAGHRALLAFADWIEQLQRLAEAEPALAIFDRIYQDSGYEMHLETVHGGPQKSEPRKRRVQQLRDWLRRLGSDEKLQNLDNLVNHLNLRDMLDKQESDRPQVQLMTLHSAKGLEFRQVFIVGCEEGLLPHANSGESLEEERRLLYVGITRAREDLQISYCQQRSVGFGKGASKKMVNASPFLRELPAEYQQESAAQRAQAKADGQRLVQQGLAAMLADLAVAPAPPTPPRPAGLKPIQTAAPRRAATSIADIIKELDHE